MILDSARVDSRTSEDRRSLTVLHIAPTPFFADRGAHLRIRGIISALNRKGLRNILCTYHHGRDIPGIETVRIPRIPGYRKQEAGPSPGKYLADLLLLWKVSSVIANARPDVVHGHLHEGALIGWVAKTTAFQRRVPLVFDVQGSLVGELDAYGYLDRFGILKRFFWLSEYAIAKLPNYFTCSSQAGMASLTEEFGVPSALAEVVNDGYDVLAPVGSALALRTGLGIPAGKPVVIYTGGLYSAKGLDTLHAVLNEANKRDLDCHFLIAGYPAEQFGRLVAESALSDICTVSGRFPVEQLADYLALASVALEPKHSDSGEASGKLLNYMAAGLPVVAFDSLNNRQILGEAGYLAVAVSPPALVDQIEAALALPEEASARGASGRKRVQETFSWDAAADQVLGIYRRLTSSRGPAMPQREAGGVRV